MSLQKSEINLLYLFIFSLNSLNIFLNIYLTRIIFRYSANYKFSKHCPVSIVHYFLCKSKNTLHKSIIIVSWYWFPKKSINTILSVLYCFLTNPRILYCVQLFNIHCTKNNCTLYYFSIQIPIKIVDCAIFVENPRMHCLYCSLYCFCSNPWTLYTLMFSVKIHEYCITVYKIEINCNFVWYIPGYLTYLSIQRLNQLQFCVLQSWIFKISKYTKTKLTAVLCV